MPNQPVSESRPDRPPGEGLLRALNVPRNVLVGLFAGLLLAAGAYLVRVFELLGPVPNGRQYPIVGPEGYFLLLAFVLAAGTAMLVATVLTVASALRLAREI